MYNQFLTGTDIVYHYFSKVFPEPKISERSIITTDNHTKCLICRQIRKRGIIIQKKSDLSRIFSSSFNDTHQIYFKPDVPYYFVCHKCYFLLKAKNNKIALNNWFSSYKKTIVTPNEVLAFHSSKNEPKAGEKIYKQDKFIDFILEPPEPPFVIYVFEKKQYGPMFWKARVSWSKDLFYIQFYENEICIDRPFLLSLLNEGVDIVLKYKKYLNYFSLFVNDISATTLTRKVREDNMQKELEDVLLHFKQKIPQEYMYLFSESSTISFYDYFQTKLTKKKEEALNVF